MFRIVRPTLSLTVLAVSTFLVAAEPTPRPMPSVATKPSFAPQSLAYLLQADKLARPKAAAVKRLAGCNRDLVVLDASYNTEPNGKWTTADIQQIRNGRPGRRVVAYVSIGEAESYRPYWQNAWTDKSGRLTSQAPKFLGPANPDWPGNYRAKYWNPQCQAIIGDSIDAVVRQGFDGIYLDIVDGFEFFEFDATKNDYIDDRKNPETGNTYRQDMIRWVLALATRARAKAGEKFLVIPQNASQLLADPQYLKTIDAIGVEDLFTNGNKKQPPREISERLGDLQAARKAGKPVLAIEYGTQPTARAASEQGAREHGLILLLTDRKLTGRDL
jgi:cysteinyl-tRNA synthetase